MASRSPAGGLCSCVAAFLAIGFILSPYLLWTGFVGSLESRYSTGPFVVGQATIFVAGQSSFVSAYSTFGSLDDTVCSDSNVVVSLAGGTNMTFNNFADWSEQYGFCSEANGSVHVPRPASTIQAFGIITFILALLATVFACSEVSTQKRRNQTGALLSVSAAIGVIIMLAEIGSWQFYADLRDGNGVMPVQITISQGTEVFVGWPVTDELKYGPSYLALWVALFLLLGSTASFISKKRAPVLADDDLVKFDPTNLPSIKEADDDADAPYQLPRDDGLIRV